jgi:hypothetical protein
MLNAMTDTSQLDKATNAGFLCLRYGPLVSERDGRECVDDTYLNNLNGIIGSLTSLPSTYTKIKPTAKLATSKPHTIGLDHINSVSELVFNVMASKSELTASTRVKEPR